MKISQRRDRDAKRAWRSIEILLDERGVTPKEFGRLIGSRQWSHPSRRVYSWMDGKPRFPSFRSLMDALAALDATMEDYARCYSKAVAEEAERSNGHPHLGDQPAWGI